MIRGTFTSKSRRTVKYFKDADCIIVKFFDANGIKVDEINGSATDEYTCLEAAMRFLEG